MKHDINGSYVERGRWHDTGGNSGELAGTITLTRETDGLRFHYGDGEQQFARLDDDQRLHAPLIGAASAGVLFVCEDAIILEYEATAGGPTERNTDVWVFRDGMTSRHGIIRQADRTIWFEATMERSS